MLMAPAGTPTDIIQKLSAETARVLNSAEVQEQAPGLGFDVGVGNAVTPVGAKRFLEEELAATGKVIQELGIQPE
jgi:tripartite-type tricarboxylate transporter receptor subunit TctC